MALRSTGNVKPGNLETEPLLLGDRCPTHPRELVRGTCGGCETWVCPVDSVEIQDVLVCFGCAERPLPLAGKRVRRPYRNWRPFESARHYARALGLKSREAWAAHARGEGAGPPRPKDVPADPSAA